jgi:hypothetical protein
MIVEFCISYGEQVSGSLHPSKKNDERARKAEKKKWATYFPLRR